MAKGLFHRAIAPSGAVILAGDPLVLSHAGKRGETAAARWAGRETASLGALRALSTTQILEAEPDLGRNVDPSGAAFPNLGITHARSLSGTPTLEIRVPRQISGPLIHISSPQ